MHSFRKGSIFNSRKLSDARSETTSSTTSEPIQENKLTPQKTGTGTGTMTKGPILIGPNENPDLVFPYETKIASKHVKKETRRVLFDFPEDDIVEVKVKRQLRTVPAKDLSETDKMTPHIQECVTFYTQDWVSLKRQHKKFPIEEPDLTKMKNLIYERGSNFNALKIEKILKMVLNLSRFL